MRPVPPAPPAARCLLREVEAQAADFGSFIFGNLKQTFEQLDRVEKNLVRVRNFA